MVNVKQVVGDFATKRSVLDCVHWLSIALIEDSRNLFDDEQWDLIATL